MRDGRRRVIDVHTRGSLMRSCFVAAMATVMPLLAAPIASAAPSVAAVPAASCADTAIHGSLGLGINGGRLDCGRWVLLEFNRWQILRPDVEGGTRRQIQMYADSADTIDFDYTA